MRDYQIEVTVTSHRIGDTPLEGEQVFHRTETVESHVQFPSILGGIGHGAQNAVDAYKEDLQQDCEHEEMRGGYCPECEYCHEPAETEYELYGEAQ